MSERIIKSKERVRKFAEVFTPDWLVRKMVDLLPDEAFEAGKTVLEPACGEGAFLADILHRKLSRVKPGSEEAFLALASLYGVEIQADNVAACRRRLLDIFRPWALDVADERKAAWILGWNIVCGDFLKGTDMDGWPIAFNLYAILDGKFAVIGRERLFPPGQEPCNMEAKKKRKRRKA